MDAMAYPKLVKSVLKLGAASLRKVVPWWYTRTGNEVPGAWGTNTAPDTAASSPKKGMVYESRRISTSCVRRTQ